MIEASLYLLAFAAAAAGCLSIERRHIEVFGNPPSPMRRLLLKIAAWILLAAALCEAVFEQGPGIGAVEWTIAAGLGAILLIVVASFRPRWVPRLGVMAACWGMALTVIG